MNKAGIERPMATSTEQLVATAATAAILLLVMFYNNARARNAPAVPANEPSTDPILCKFVHHEGRVVGETVALAGADVVLKQAGEFKLVPRNQIESEGEDLVVKGYVDWNAARTAGSSWLASRRKEADPEVTGQLTRSEDVVAPALSAMRARHGSDEEE